MRKDNELLCRCNGDCTQGRNCDCFDDGFENSAIFWIVLIVTLIMAFGMPWWLI